MPNVGNVFIKSLQTFFYFYVNVYYIYGLRVRLDQQRVTLRRARLLLECVNETGKPSRSITNHQFNSAFHPPGYVNRVPACLAGVKAGCVHLCRVAGNTV